MFETFKIQMPHLVETRIIGNTGKVSKKGHMRRDMRGSRQSDDKLLNF